MTRHPNIRGPLMTLGLCLVYLNAQAAQTAIPEIRRVPVTLVTDAQMRKVDSWRGVLRGALDRATEDLRETAGLAFVVVDEVSWEPSEPAGSLEALLDMAVASVGPRDGIVAVFLGKHPDGLPVTDDRAFGYLGYPALVVLATDRNKLPFGAALREHLAMLVRHELGHCFGMPHTRSDTIMNPVPTDRAWEFGELELDILRATRNIDMGTEAPFVNCDLETLRDVYLILAERGDMEPALLVNLGVAFHREGKLEDAKDIFAKAMVWNRGSLAAKLGLAQTVLAMDDGGEHLARLIAENLSVATGLTPEMRGALGGVWLELGEYERAEACLDEAIGSGPPVFSFLFNRGVVRFHQERFAEARTDFNAALDVEERPEGWFNLGLACDALRDRTTAIEAFERYLALAPDGPNGDEARKFLERNR